MTRADIKPKQSLGQNFLVDQNIARNIINALELCDDDIVLEIGPGLGILTFLLQPKVKKLITVEIDKNLADNLKMQLAGKENVTVIQQDFLKFDLDSIAMT